MNVSSHPKYYDDEIKQILRSEGLAEAYDFRVPEFGGDFTTDQDTQVVVGPMVNYKMRFVP